VKLAPCFECGEGGRIMALPDWFGTKWRFVCERCFSAGVLGADRADAARMWNECQEAKAEEFSE